jgi:tetratricopeptide (TPR) repeat protein
MKRRLWDYGIPALASVIVAGATGCAAHPLHARPELNTRQTVAMVRAGQFAALNRYYGAVQAAYDKGSLSDEKLRAEFRHFDDASPDLAARYQSWVKQTPYSYVARVASAIYYVKVGQASRGSKSIADTSEAQLSGMDAAFKAAFWQLQKSYPLERKPILTVFYLLDIGMFEGEAAQNRQLLRDSLEIDPKNFIVREMYIQTLTTAWGGSTEKIEAFVAESKAAGLSTGQMNALESFVFSDQAWIDEFDNRNYKRAAAEYLEAAKLSGDDACLLCAGRMLTKAGDFPNAVPVLTRYLARNPDSAEALEMRAYVNFRLKRIADGVHDCERAAALGDAYCEFTIGMAYTVAGLGFPKDLNKAIDLLHRAALQGYEPARNLLQVALSEQEAHSHPIGVTRSPAS